jgi:hypothetical protein
MLQWLGNQLQQTSGVGMKRPAVHLCDGARFDDTAGVHHQDSICEAGQQSWIVCNKEERRSVFAIDIAQSILNL